jgi:hypothetical protein
MDEKVSMIDGNPLNSSKLGSPWGRVIINIFSNNIVVLSFTTPRLHLQLPFLLGLKKANQSICRAVRTVDENNYYEANADEN